MLHAIPLYSKLHYSEPRHVDIEAAVSFVSGGVHGGAHSGGVHGVSGGSSGVHSVSGVISGGVNIVSHGVSAALNSINKRQGRGAPRAPPSAAEHQADLDQLMEALEGEEGPTYYSFSMLLSYLTRAPVPLIDGAFGDTLRAVSQKLLAVGGGPVYLADGKAFTKDALGYEFPELELFCITAASAFVESPVHSGLWVETRRFADLRALSRVRRELRKTGLADAAKTVDVVKVLLGIERLH